MSDEVKRQALSFGEVADTYDRGRPGYPADAVEWLVGTEPLSILELGAGTGKLTEQLVALGHDVHATDPDEAMLAVLRERLPDVPTSPGTAEEIPAADSSYDLVVAAQCFHWFDAERALPEVRRVLKPRGRFSLVWNQRDERIPWVKKLGRIIGTQEQLTDPTELLDTSMKFILVESATFSQWQRVDRRTIQDLVSSRSNVAVLDEAGRAEVLEQVLDLYDSYGRGMDGMQLPYDVRCYRSRVVKSPATASVTTSTDAVVSADAVPLEGDGVLIDDGVDGLVVGGDASRDDGSTTGSAETSPPGDDGTLLIDFR